MSKVASAKDLIMLLLYARGHTGQQCDPIRGRTRLMKMVFLFDKEARRKFNLGKAIPKEAIPRFEAYDYGPFSAQVFADLEFLVDLGFVEVAKKGDEGVLPEESLEYDYWQAGSGTPPGDDISEFEEEEFVLTETGRGFVIDGQAGELTNEQWAFLDEFKTRCTQAPLRSLLKYVYTKYPKMTKKSKIRDEVVAEYAF